MPTIGDETRNLYQIGDGDHTVSLYQIGDREHISNLCEIGYDINNVYKIGDIPMYSYQIEDNTRARLRGSGTFRRH